MSRSLRSFLESHIAVPDTMYCFRGGKLQREIVPQGDLYVIYVAPSACSSCAISQLSSYADLFSLGDSLGFSALILLSPQEGSETEVLHTLSSRNLDIPVWLDIDHRFFDANPSVPEDPRFHRFLLSSSGFPTLVGDPLTPRMRELLQKYYGKK